MGSWFTNRGQMVQAGLAFAALALGVIINWGELSSRLNFQSLWPVLLMPLAIIVGFQVGRKSVSGEPISVGSKPNELKLDTQLITLTVGSRHDIEDGFFKCRIVIVAIKPALKDGALSAEIEIESPTLGPLNIGKNVKKLDFSRVIMPVQPSNYLAEAASAFAFGFDRNTAHLFSIRVDHINNSSGEVRLDIGRLFAHRAEKIEPQ